MMISIAASAAALSTPGITIPRQTVESGAETGSSSGNLNIGSARSAPDGTASRSDEINGLTPEELKQVRKLAARDREVRAHEQAHASVGGQYAGSPTYSYQRGPDGRQYAVGGEVPIDTAPVPGDPEATIAKARVVRRAALAPAQPSPQDRAVAAEATAIEQRARAELLAGKDESSEAGNGSDERSFRLADYQPIDIRV